MGCTSYFVSKSDLSTLFDDWALVRPTQMVLVPRVVEALFQHYRTGVDRRVAEGADPPDAKKGAAAEVRERVGGRVLGGCIGTAPLAPELKAFLDSGLDVHIADGYGLTETGTGQHGWCDQPQEGARLQADRRSRTRLLQHRPALPARGVAGQNGHDDAGLLQAPRAHRRDVRRGRVLPNR